MDSGRAMHKEKIILLERFAAPMVRNSELLVHRGRRGETLRCAVSRTIGMLALNR
jgi:hypothetical protein